jgi:TFIIF-interacting CTD phosphatase-like protein
MTQKSNILLVLDLDETLIHATKNKLDEPLTDFTFDQYFVYKRPYLDTFLSEISKHFKFGIWSSAGDNYVEEIVKQILPTDITPEFVWGRSKCTIKRDKTFDTYFFEKRLDKLKRKGFQLEKIIIVDDTVEKVASNYGNAIYINEFNGNLLDNELQILQEYLITLKTVENVRTIEKRHWRREYGGT